VKEIDAHLANIKRTIDEAYELLSTHDSKESEEIQPDVKDELTRIFKSAINPAP